MVLRRLPGQLPLKLTQISADMSSTALFLDVMSDVAENRNRTFQLPEGFDPKQASLTWSARRQQLVIKCQFLKTGIA